jgi:hypothetical protein
MRARRISLPVVLWVFGLATSLLLFGMWGRTITVDSETVQEAARTVVDADLATERVSTWLEAGLEAAAGTDSATAQAVTRAIAERPEFAEAVDSIVDDFVSGLFAETGEDPVVDVEQALRPLVPIVVAEFNRREVTVAPERIDEALDAASVIELDTGEAASIANVVDDANALLTNVVLLAAAILLAAGAAAITLSEKRYAMLRTLSLRFLLSAMSYAIVFRLAAWALDPSRGRSPVLGGGSVLLGSNNEVFLIPAVVAAVVAAFGGFVAWRRAKARRLQELTDDDTRELIAV